MCLNKNRNSALLFLLCGQIFDTPLKTIKSCALILSLCMATSTALMAQSTFKAGWNTYNTRMIIHEYAYSLVQNDSVRLYITDSSQTFVSPDSLVTVTLNFAARDKAIYKTVNYFNIKKQILKTEEYKDNNMLEVNDWKYDDKNRKIVHITDNKINGNVYKKLYDYSTDKKNSDFIVTESAYFNGKIEFYTKSYYDKNTVKYKEVRLNDNNKDVIHIETYTYGENGKVKERSVHFPEFKVTKKFTEPGGSVHAKCFKTMPVGTADKVNPSTKIAYIKRVIAKNQGIISDPECREYEYKFTNFANCDITIATTKINNSKRLVYCYKEKLM